MGSRGGTPSTILPPIDRMEGVMFRMNTSRLYNGELGGFHSRK
jgi:hypothetical protein